MGSFSHRERHVFQAIDNNNFDIGLSYIFISPEYTKLWVDTRLWEEFIATYAMNLGELHKVL